MIHIFSGDAHYNQEDCHRKHLAGTRRPGDILWRSPKDPNVWGLQGTFRGLSGDQYKNWKFYEKISF